MPPVLRILLVEDDAGDAVLLGRALSATGEAWDVTTCGTLAEAFRRLEEGAIDVALVDVDRPDGQGPETVRRFRERAPDLPLVALSALDDGAAAAAACALGAQDYLAKNRVTGDVVLRSVQLAIERRRAAKALETAREQFVVTFESCPHPLLITSLDEGRVVEANASFLEQFGYDASEIAGRTVQELGLWVDPSARARMLEKLATDGTVRDWEAQVRTKSGEERSVLISGARITVGGRDCLFTLATDVTDRKIAEEQLRHAQRMEAVGRLAGGIAHDFNNLLTVILGYSTLALGRVRPGDPLVEDLREIRDAGERAAGLTRQLLAFSRKQILRPVALDVNATIRDMARMLERLIGEDVDLVIACDPDAGHVMVDPSQLEQVIANLAVNARDAMPRGGTLTIGTHGAGNEGDVIRLTVRDTGCGMSRETIGHIFEPFFTTKGPGKGTGLGLATVYGIVKQSGGWVEVSSEEGAGTEFRIYLPRFANGDVLAHESSRTEAEAPRGSETILLAEDQADVRKLTGATLARLGYTVLEASNGGEALLLCEQHEGDIDLLLTDVVMPRMSGRQLAERLAALRPTMKVLYMSGYTEDSMLQHGISKEGVFFLPKPFAPVGLARAVRAVLDRR
jgi:PAS domain S-box-containing protein